MMTNVYTGIVQKILWISKCNKSSKVLGTYAKLSGYHPGVKSMGSEGRQTWTCYL